MSKIQVTQSQSQVIEQAIRQAMSIIVKATENVTEERVRADIMSKLGVTFEPTAKRGPGRPRGSGKTKVVDATKRNHMRKPCPVPGCANMAAPRHHMVCKDHGTLPLEEINNLKFRARQPGGAWSTEPATAEAAPRRRAGRKAAA